ncbi:chalcone isomerase family protein [Halomonas koreensis]|uniref:Chalcone isomerase family protein n=1 Tax=Halomonas koreensis TaxID=245385 RepID=A0ABU1G0C4_9GAMM|nr:chalcone isomerase family protein [Halomonas koreensis]MDR5866390.1 chalcone isomerase family protein [Halomonas koreensis]
MRIALTRATALPIALALLLALPPEAGAGVEGVRFDARLEVEGRPYRRLGQGLFRYLIWDAYAGAYYQAEGFPRPAPQAAEVPRRLELEYFRAIAAEDFAEVTRDTLREQLDDDAFRSLSPALSAFNARYRDVAPGDRYALTWTGDTLTLALNGEVLYARPEPRLADALFGIWLGEAPLGDGFRDALLGR